MKNWTNLRILLDAEGGGNGGGGSSSGSGGSDPDAAFQRLLDRNNSDGIGLARQLFSENYGYRQENRKLKEELDDLTGKVPDEGALVLSEEEAQAWKAYQELGDVAEVKQGLEQRTQLQEQLDEAQRTETLRTVAQAAGYKANVLGQLERMARASGKELAFELREQTVDGQQVQIPIVKDGETEQPLPEYAEAQWADFLPALAVADNGTPQGGVLETPPANNVQGTPTPPGLRFPPQHPGGTPAPVTTKTIAEKTLRRAYADRPEKQNPAI